MFSTNLVTPIEEILHETLSEIAAKPLQAGVKKKAKSNKNKGKVLQSESIKFYNTNVQTNLCDNLNTKIKICQDINQKADLNTKKELSKKHNIKESANSQSVNVPKEKSSVRKNISCENFKSLVKENLDFSNTLVDEKNKQKKEARFENEKCEQETLKKFIEKSISKTKNSPDISKHYNIKNSVKHQAIVEPLPFLSRRFSNSFEKVHVVETNSLEEKPNGQTESNLKESKKVSSSISYASVVLNRCQNSVEINDYVIANNQVPVKPNEISNSNERISDAVEIFKSIDFKGSIELEPSAENKIVDYCKTHLTEIDILDSNEINTESVVIFEKSVEQNGVIKCESNLGLKISDEDNSNLEIIPTTPVSTGSLFLESIKNQPGPKETTDVQESLLKFAKHPGVSLLIEELQETSVINKSSDKDLEDSSISLIDYQNNFKRDERNIEEFIDDDFISHTHQTTNFSIPVEEYKINNLKGLPSQNIIEDFVVLESEQLDSTKNFIEKSKENYILSENFSLNNFQCSTFYEIVSEPNSTKYKQKVYTGESNFPSCDFTKEETSIKLNLETMPQTRILTLNESEHQESTLYRLEKNWTLQFRLGPSLFGRKVFLYCNYPLKGNGFIRHRYNLIPWELDDGCKNADDTACCANITLKIAGSFHYYFTFAER